MKLSEALRGARIQRLDIPTDGLLVLSVRRPELKGALFLGVSPIARGVGWTERRVKGAFAGTFAQNLRRQVEGARVVALEQPTPGLLRIGLTRGDRTFRLIVQLYGRGNVVVLDADENVRLAMRRLEPGEDPGIAPAGAAGAELEAPTDTLAARAASMHAHLQAHALEQAKTELQRALRSRRRRLLRRLDAIAEDRRRADAAGQLRKHASLVLAHLHELPEDAESAELNDFEGTEPTKLRLTFDRALGPRRQAEAWFQRARKLERGAALAEQRDKLTRAELERVEGLLARSGLARSFETIEALRTDVRDLGLSPANRAVKRRASAQSTPRSPYREFVGSRKRSILVGRGSADNDRLTLDHARPYDLWLHVRDYAGSHVVVPLDRSETCPPELLCDAATLAAHFSQARDQDAVDVIYTPRRYVRKPRKAPPGRMSIEREKVFRLRVEKRRLVRLLATEIRSS